MSDLSRKATKVNTLLPYLYTEHILVNIFHQTVLLSGKDKVTNGFFKILTCPFYVELFLGFISISSLLSRPLTGFCFKLLYHMTLV
jgi:hypothetical protein